MGCLGAVLILLAPRFVMIVLWIFTNYLSRAYSGLLIPLLGFFFLPTTTLAYAIAENEVGGFRSWGVLLLVVAFLTDLGVWGRGRGIFSNT